MERGRRKERIGVVTSDKMNKTIVVEVERKFQHEMYKKVVKATKRFKVHDETNQAKVGDRVLIMETRPISKDKRWRLISIESHGQFKARELPARRQKKEKQEGQES